LRRFFAVTATLLVVPVALLGVNLYSFNRLTDEEPIARLHFVEMAPQSFAVEILTGDFCSAQHLVINGDEWRLDARFLKWKPLANLLGFDSLYRIDRLAGRYSRIEDANRQPHIEYRIGEQPLVELTDYLNQDWLGWSPVDTSFGSSVYERIDPDYEYIVFRSQSALLVRKQRSEAARYESGSLVINIEKPCRK
jgi:hypothetical protein